MASKQKRKLGSRQKFLLGLIYEEPFITYDELYAEVKTKFSRRGAQGLALTLGSMETHGWITSKNKSYAATRVGKETFLSTQNTP